MIDAAQKGKAQVVTRCGVPVAVVLSFEEFEKLQRIEAVQSSSIIDHLFGIPSDGGEFKRMNVQLRDFLISKVFQPVTQARHSGMDGGMTGFETLVYNDESWSLGTSDGFRLLYPSQVVYRLCQLWNGYCFVTLQLLNGACYVPVPLRYRAHSSEHQTIHEVPEHIEDIQLNNESGRHLARLGIHI